jgi:hypothetical protein
MTTPTKCISMMNKHIEKQNLQLLMEIGLCENISKTEVLDFWKNYLRTKRTQASDADKRTG